ncbi:hypothetical protein [Helcococcus kunzii]|uniref:hypothetical protein n=1 Tax=Helcococcus kunzii TaxID=40091 RepID=UPI0024AE481B|nr:hypothetical protein [Helcococcus kunzii]
MGILKQVYKSNRLVRVIIFVQIIFSLLMSITFYNRYKTVNKLSAELWNTPLRNSIVFMGKPAMASPQMKSEEKFMKEKDKVYEYCKNHPETFIGVSPKYMDNNYQVGDNLYATVTMLDKLTMKMVESHFEGNYNIEQTDNKIPVVVQSEYRNQYKKGDVVSSTKSGEKVQFIVEGYYDSDTQIMSVGVLGLGDRPWESLFQKVQMEYPHFIILENDKITEIAEKSDYEERGFNEKQSLLYLNEKATEKDLEEFDKFVNENKLGYYTTSDRMFAEQNKDLEYMFNSRFDLILAFILILILTIISIGYVNKDKLENRYKIYYLNGLSLKSMYFVTIVYYALIFIIPFIFYNLLFKLFEIDYFKNIFATYIPFLDRLILDDYNLHLDEILILSAIFILIISVISYWPVKNIRNKYSKQRYGVKK